MASALIHRWLDRVSRLTTAFHLWCAEHELRAADAGSLPPRLRQARLRNLDLLRRYRRQGEFPRNARDCSRALPCFVDGDGQRCAVAYLMHESGAGPAADRIAAAANYARVREMPGLALEGWARDTGLSRADLARIQPLYSPSFAAAERYAEIVWAVWLVGAIAANSVLFNVARLAWSGRPRRTTAALGLLAGVFLMGFCATIDARPFGHTRLHGEVWSMRLLGFGLGAVSVYTAWVSWGRSRRPKDAEPRAAPDPAGM